MTPRLSSFRRTRVRSSAFAVKTAAKNDGLFDGMLNQRGMLASHPGKKVCAPPAMCRGASDGKNRDQLRSDLVRWLLCKERLWAVSDIGRLANVALAAEVRRDAKRPLSSSPPLTAPGTAVKSVAAQLPISRTCTKNYLASNPGREPMVNKFATAGYRSRFG
jgi:hypothetical protein